MNIQNWLNILKSFKIGVNYRASDHRAKSPSSEYPKEL